MKILNRYIISTLLKATGLIFLVFAGLEIFILLATQLGSIGKGSYSIFQAIMYVLLILPQQTYFLFPMIGLIGMLFGFSWLANHNELTVMRAAGVSPLKILSCTLQAGIVLIVLMTFIGEAIGPAAKALGEKRKLFATSTVKALKTSQGIWLRQGQNFYYIKNIYSPHSIGEISQYTFQNQQLVSASVAQEGRYENGAWQISNIQMSLITPEQIRTVFTPKAIWNMAVNPDLLMISQQLPDEMSLPALKDLIDYQKSTRVNAKNNEIIFWQRLLQPIASLIMMFLAVPFIFGQLRSVSTSLRLLLGVVVGFAFYISNQLFPPLSQVLDFPPLIAAVLPLIIFATIGIFFFRRIY